MHATALALPTTATGSTPTGSTDVDSRAAYTAFAAAYVLGHGSAALSRGPSPLVALPTWLPWVLLGAGIVAGMVLGTTESLRAQRHADDTRRRAEKLVGTAWATGFTALFLAITGLASTFDNPALQDVLWPAGSTLLVGVIYLAEAAIRHNTLHYALGTVLALLGGAALLLPVPAMFATLAVAGGGAYAVAAVLERRRLA